jgi:hypothetical protein
MGHAATYELQILVGNTNRKPYHSNIKLHFNEALTVARILAAQDKIHWPYLAKMITDLKVEADPSGRAV